MSQLDNVVKVGFGVILGASIFVAAHSQTIGPAPGGGGSGAVTCGSTDTQICFNNGGAFAGAPGLLYGKTNKTTTITDGSHPVVLEASSNAALSGNAIFTWDLTAASGGGPSSTVSVVSGGFAVSSSGSPWYNTANLFTYDKIGMQNAAIIGWASSGQVFNGLDTSLARNAAGVVEVNNGTPGTLADITLRLAYVKGFAVANLPTPTGAGAIAYVTDQLTACPAAGAALIGGGAVKCAAFYNGTAWVGL